MGTWSFASRLLLDISRDHFVCFWKLLIFNPKTVDFRVIWGASTLRSQHRQVLGTWNYASRLPLGQPWCIITENMAISMPCFPFFEIYDFLTQKWPIFVFFWETYVCRHISASVMVKNLKYQDHFVVFWNFWFLTQKWPNFVLFEVCLCVQLRSQHR